jgi:hypothetical protein
MVLNIVFIYRKLLKVVRIVFKHFCKLYERNRNQKIEKREKEIKKEEKAAGKPTGPSQIRPTAHPGETRRGMPFSPPTR